MESIKERFYLGKPREYKMTYENMHRILTRRFKRRNALPNHRYSTIPLLCSHCEFPIALGNEVISKSQDRGNTAVYHRKCLEASYY